MAVSDPTITMNAGRAISRGKPVAALLFAALIGYAAVSPVAAAEGAGDSGLLFWAVNEGGARIYRPDAAACSRIGGLSAQYAEALSTKYQVPAYQLKVVEVRPPQGEIGCRLVIDMPGGARECQIGSVIRTFGGSFLAHTYAQDADGSVRYIAGACR